MAVLEIYNDKNKFEFEEGEFIFKILQENGIKIEVPCGGVGTCGKCKVRVVGGETTPLSPEELEHLSKDEIDGGIRLSCLTKALGNVTIELLNLDENHKILTDGYMPNLKINPPITKKIINLSECELNKNNYEEIVNSELNVDKIQDIESLKALQKSFKTGNLTSIFLNDELIGIEHGINKKIYGIAVDIGTTTVVASLIDMVNGVEIASETMINPQKEYGSDVLSRIDFANKNENGLELLNNAIIGGINKLIFDLSTQNNISVENIYEVSIAANTTMMHFLLNIDAESIGKSPYLSVFLSGKNIPSKDVGINISPFGRIYCLPGVSGYIGADIVAGVIVSELLKAEKNVLFIDIGTNGEIIFSKKGILSSCSCAAGPALEGMNISHGMRAANGAIEGIKFTENGVELKVIGNKDPVGICGSGILDSISEIVRTGLVGKTGRLINANGKNNEYTNLIIEKNSKKFVQISKSPEIVVSQKDIRQVQLAKAAIVSGFLALLDENNLTMEEIDEVIIAGQFGKHLTVESLVGSGIIPEKLGKKVRYIGNSSKTGALMCLLSKESRNEMESVSKDIKYFELSTKENYEKLFVDSLNF
ncbi:ferredoxin [Methanococcus maripaludis C5]|uniref:Ferredoxin n=1 Tax=Methanococcus maripaludis (strain C5 / ATCC BAA-1333) TaxID=402880 RepID=A4FY62_METM5|nr:ASKHA domain-containing protein [Methanococcus maripaludis]ABO35146.1 ferredoxin [Methanococcus maripaludis C5]